MTEKDEKQHILEAIEKLVSGEPLDLESIPAGDRSRLLEIARELSEFRPEPSDEFEERLRQRLEDAGISAGAGVEETRDEGRHRRWLPGWITLPRVAAVAAVVVLGLGVAGMTSAIISGGPGSINNNDVVSEKNTDLEDSSIAGTTGAESMRYQDQAAGNVPGEEGQPSTGTASPEELGNLPGGGAADIPTVRQVIQTADYEIELPVGEFQDKYNQVTDIAAKYGGYVASASTRASDDDNAIKHGSITIRIADTGENFTKAMEELDGLGRVVSRSVSGQDITEEYVDLQSRLRNAQAHEASLLALMDKAQTIDEMLTVESQLTTVRSEIERLQGQINYLDNRTDFASISIELYEEDAVAQKDRDGHDWGFVSALQYAGWLAVQTVNFVIMSLGVIVPAALLATLLLLISYRLVQRWRS